MRKSILFIELALALVIGLSSSTSASAQEFLTVTQCDSASIGGVELDRATFTIHNSASTMLQFLMVPVDYETPGDTCRVIPLASSNGWLSHTNKSGSAVWSASGLPYIIPPGAVLGGFQVALRRPVCCFRVQFFGPLVEPYTTFTTCLRCPIPTPIRQSTWGRLKQAYR